MMPNTYTQLHIQCIFAVKFREALIPHDKKERIHEYITGIVHSFDHKMLRINSMPDHLHMLIGFRPTQSLSDLMCAVKADSSKWINENRIIRQQFRWQEGYSAFSYSRSQVPDVIDYIKYQEIHHRKVDFQTELRSLLQEFDIAYDEKYLFHPPV